MATHGFIDIREEGEITGDRTLVHCVHDGYVEDMVRDLLHLPFHIAHTLEREHMFGESAPDFLRNRNVRSHIAKCTRAADSFEDALELWTSVIPIDDVRHSLASYLISYRPDKYNTAAEPFMLYGQPVTDAGVCLLFSGGRVDSAFVGFSSSDNQDIQELIDSINGCLTDARIEKVDHGFHISFTAVAVDLLRSATMNSKSHVWQMYDRLKASFGIAFRSVTILATVFVDGTRHEVSRLLHLVETGHRDGVAYVESRYT